MCINADIAANFFAGIDQDLLEDFRVMSEHTGSLIEYWYYNPISDGDMIPIVGFITPIMNKIK
jgi:hypothetical protein